MASGPEHYIEAEKHLRYSREGTLGSDSERYNLAAAQIHALLALAAAQALEARDQFGNQWREAMTAND